MALAPVFLWAGLALGSGVDAGDVVTVPRPDSVRIEVAGYDSTCSRIYWRQMRSGAPVEVRYFDLNRTCDGGGPSFDVTVESTCEVTVGTRFYQVPERMEVLLVVTTTNPACVQQSAVLLP